MGRVMKLGLGLYRHMLTEDGLRFARQAGATHVVVHLVDYFHRADEMSGRGNQPVGGDGGWGVAGQSCWDMEELRRIKCMIEDAGLVWEAIENFDPMDWHDVLLDGPRKEEQLEHLKVLIERVGEVGVPIIGYNFSIAGVCGRCSGAFARGGAMSVGMDGVNDSPMPRGMAWNMVYDESAGAGVVSSATVDELWKRFQDFLNACLPVAEAAGVRLALHPDDPPMPMMRKQPRLVYQPNLYQRVIDMNASESNQLEFCVGTIAEMPGADVYDAIDRYSQQHRIGYVHLRNVHGQVPNYRETFIDDGDVDVKRVLEILHANKFDGVVIPDHTPLMACDAPWHAGMAYAMGYLKSKLDDMEKTSHAIASKEQGRWALREAVTRDADGGGVVGSVAGDVTGVVVEERKVSDVFIRCALTESQHARIRDALPGCAVHVGAANAVTDTDAQQMLAKSQVAFGQVPCEWLSRAEQLAWVQLDSVGFDPYLGLDRAGLPRTLAITNLQGLFAQPVAETAIAGVMALYRGIDDLVICKESQVWDRSAIRSSLRCLHGTRVLLVGYGSIGQALHEKFSALGCDVVTYARTNPEAQIHTVDALDEALLHAEVVCLSLPQTRETVGLFDGKRLASMKKTSVLVNVGRAGVVDESALIEAMTRRQLAGVVLDVTSQEPLPAAHALWSMSNAILTQHTGGGMATEQDDKVTIFLNNMARYQRGQPLQHVIDLERGY